MSTINLLETFIARREMWCTF